MIRAHAEAERNIKTVMERFKVYKPVFGWTQESYPEREDVATRFPDSAYCRQVHGTVIHYVNRPGFYGDGDGLYTDNDDVMLTVRTADCNGIVLYDDECNYVMAIHAGWKGTASGILEKGIGIMRENRIDVTDIKLFFAPSARDCCYEVGEDIIPSFKPELLEYIHERNGKLYCDLVGMNKRYAFSAGILEENITVEPKCTICDTSLFSYRRSKSTDRHVVYIKKG